MQALYKVALATVRIWIREPLTVFLSLGLLALMMVLFSTIGNDMSQFQLRVGVAASPAQFDVLSSQFREDGTLHAIRAKSAEELEKELALGRISAGVVASDASVVGGQSTNYLVLLPHNPLKGWAKIGSSHLVEVIDQAPERPLQRSTVRLVAAPAISPRMIEFLFPGILSLAILQTCLGSAVVFLDARRIGVLRRFRITPVQPVAWSGGFLAGRCGIVLLHLFVLTGIARLLFRVQTQGHLADACLISVIGTVCFLAMAGLIALIAPSVEAGALLTQLISFPMSFLCGVFFRNDSFPPLLTKAVDLLPFTYLVNLMRDVLQIGLPLRELKHDFYALLIWTGIALVALAFASRFSPRTAI